MITANNYIQKNEGILMKKLLFFNFSIILCAAILLTSNTMPAALRRAATGLGRAATTAGRRALIPPQRQCRIICPATQAMHPSLTLSPAELEQRLIDLEAAEEAVKEAKKAVEEQQGKLNQIIREIEAEDEAREIESNRKEKAKDEIRQLHKKIDLEKTKKREKMAKEKLDAAEVEKFDEARHNARMKWMQAGYDESNLARDITQKMNANAAQKDLYNKAFAERKKLEELEDVVQSTKQLIEQKKAAIRPRING